jgi:hypothetical protein
METGRFEHMQTLSRLQGDSDESDSEVYEIYPSAMNNADLYDVSHESDDSFETTLTAFFRFNWVAPQSNQVRVALFL